MKSHERDRLLGLVIVVNIRDQRDVLQQLLQRDGGVPLHRLLYHGHKFVQVFQPRLVLHRLFLLQGRDHPGLIHDQLHKQLQPHLIVQFLPEPGDQRGKTLQLSRRLCRDLLKASGPLTDLEHGQPLANGHSFHLVHCGCANPAFGLIDDPAQGHIVAVVLDQAQIGGQVLDFLPVIESEAAQHPVGNGRFQQRVLQNTGHGVHPVQDDGIIQTAIQLPDGVSDMIGL